VEAVPEDGGNGRGRQDGRSVPFEGERGDEAEAVDLGGGQEGDAQRAGQGVELVPVRGAGQRQQQLEVGQVVEGERPVAVGQDVALGDDQHEVLLEEEPGDQVLAADREVEDRHVQLAAGQLGLEARGGALDDDEAELRVPLGHRVHQPGDQPPCGGADHAHADGAGDLVLARGDIGQQGVELGQDPPGPRHHDGALLGEPAVGPVDERGPQLLLEPGHVGRDVGLHGAQVIGRRREGSVVADGGQCLQVSEFHRRRRYQVSRQTG
jgi:hypothetical protein